MVAQSRAKNLYNVLQEARTQPEPTISGGLPLPKRHRHAPTTMVSNLTAQQFEGGMSEQGAPLTSPQEANIPTGMAPMHVNISDSQQVYWCQAKGCPEGPSSSHATICAHVCCTHLGTKLLCPFCPIPLFNSDALKQHGKWAHQTAFLCPN